VAESDDPMATADVLEVGVELDDQMETRVVAVVQYEQWAL